MDDKPRVFFVVRLEQSLAGDGDGMADFQESVAAAALGFLVRASVREEDEG